jgi:predicted metalloendopeptidase
MKPVFDIAVLITILRQLGRRFGKLKAEQSQILEDMPLKQLEALSVALLDFVEAGDLSKWISDRGWEVYEAELAEIERNKPQRKRYVSSIMEIVGKEFGGTLASPCCLERRESILRRLSKMLSLLSDRPVKG